MRIVLDTNICIDHLRGYGPATEYLRRCARMERWISSITVMELHAAPRITAEQRHQMMRLLSGFHGIVDVDETIAQTAGNLLRRYRQHQGLNPIDAIIAATAIHMDAVLSTRNEKNFSFLEELIVDCPY